MVEHEITDAEHSDLAELRQLLVDRMHLSPAPYR
jgi:hypothetical protein